MGVGLAFDDEVGLGAEGRSCAGTVGFDTGKVAGVFLRLSSHDIIAKTKNARKKAGKGELAESSLNIMLSLLLVPPLNEESIPGTHGDLLPVAVGVRHRSGGGRLVPNLSLNSPRWIT